MQPESTPTRRGAARIATALLAGALLTAHGGAQLPPEEPVEEPGVSIHEPAAFAGYTLVAPLQSTTTYLVDMEGKPVHTWTSAAKPGGGFYLLEDGSLLRCGQVKKPPVFSAGGQGGRIQRIAWDGTLLWDFVFSNEEHLQHHDVEPLPNGNILMIAWERKSATEARAAGRNPEMLATDDFWPDMVLEIEPHPPAGGRVVWEWHVWDHLVQDHDPDRPNYGDPRENPRRVDVNGDREPRPPSPEEEAAEQERLQELGYVGAVYEEEDGADEPDRPQRTWKADWLHTNAVDYNPELDLIALSVRRFHEIWILDHSTTPREAAGSRGGRYGHGGDLVFRWGNPHAYGGGPWDAKRLFGQHDIQWILRDHPGAGNLLLFNNGSERDGRPWSSAEEFRVDLAPPGPAATATAQEVWSYTAPEKSDFYSSFISGAQRLPNGNTLICSGEHGVVFEVTPSGKTVWRWKNPFGGKADPDDPPHMTQLNDNALFRATRIAPSHPGLQNLGR